MINATIQFFGNDQNEIGMRSPFHSYFVVAAPWLERGGIATVFGSTDSTFDFSDPHVPVLEGGEEAAFNKLLAKLEGRQANLGLQKAVFKSPS